MAGTTGLEPATSAVTGQHSNQLNYVPKFYRDTLCRTGSRQPDSTDLTTRLTLLLIGS